LERSIVTLPAGDLVATRCLRGNGARSAHLRYVAPHREAACNGQL